MSLSVTTPEPGYGLIAPRQVSTPEQFNFVTSPETLQVMPLVSKEPSNQHAQGFYMSKWF